MNDLIDEERYITDLTIPYHPIKTFPPHDHTLFLGSQSAVGGFPDKWNHVDEDYESVRRELISNNIKAIVCCAELYDLFPGDFEYLHVPMESNDDFDIAAVCVTAWNWIDKKLQKGSVLVHCNAGCHRSATVTIGYIAKALQMTVNESYSFVRSKRHCVHIDNFVPQLEALVNQSCPHS